MKGTLLVPDGASAVSELKSINQVDPRFWTCQSLAGPLAINPNRSSIADDETAVRVGVAVGETMV